MKALQHEALLRNGMRVVLRTPESADAEAMLTYLKTLFAESYQNMNWPPSHWAHFPVEKERQILADSVAASSALMVAAFEGESIVGNVSVAPLPGHFSRFSVSLGMGIISRCRGVGLGRVLLEKMMQEVAAAGLRRIELRVRTFNAPAIALYESAGFRRVGLLSNAAFIDEQWHDEYIYEWQTLKP